MNLFGLKIAGLSKKNMNHKGHREYTKATKFIILRVLRVGFMVSVVNFLL